MKTIIFERTIQVVQFEPIKVGIVVERRNAEATTAFIDRAKMNMATVMESIGLADPTINWLEIKESVQK
jgi:hypothetical protein